MKKNFVLNKRGFVLRSAAAVFLTFATEVSAQIRQVPVQLQEESEDLTWWYVTLGVLAVGLIGAVAWLVKNKKAEKERIAQEKVASESANQWDANSVDADKEMEWLRKNQNLMTKKRKKVSPKALNVAAPAEGADANAAQSAATGDGQLPVFTFENVEPAKSFSPLPLSNDESLLSAVEQAYDEYEEDEEVRDLSVRILSAFKTRNSIEALSQLALYDLSASLRSKAVLTLTEFDHESVFETILLSCADPSREVRAAAARGLTRLSFDRADAWARIGETGEVGRIRQAARAATESGFVERSFDRLIHPDRQNAYEAFVLLSLLVKAGETEQIFTALRSHKNMNVRLALLHVIKMSQDQEALNELYNLLEDKKLPEELKVEVDKTIQEFGLVAA